MLDLTFNSTTYSIKFRRNFFYRIILKAIDRLNLGLNKNKIEISINLISEARIKTLNQKYRGKNKVTDVLSFPIDSKPMPRSAIIPLGDIFICLPFAKKQAKRENIDIEKKLSWLIIHGFLHLLGYDHDKSEKDRLEMEKLENKILNS